MRKFAVFVSMLIVMLSGCQPTARPDQGAAGIGDPYYADLGNGGYDVRQYTISLAIDPLTNEVQGSAAIDATATKGLSSFDLDFVGLTVDSITIDGSAATYSRTDHELIISPAGPLKNGQEFMTVVAYHGNPSGVRGVTSAQWLKQVGWSHAQNGAINVLSEPNGAAGWYPVNDHPRDKALYRFEITVPKPWAVAATGTLTETVDQGAQTKYIWVMDQPLASYLASINVDQYTLKTLPGPDGVIIRNYFPPGYPESYIHHFDILPEMISYLESVYGPYPFKEYGVVVANEENPMCLDGGTAVETQTLSVHCPSEAMASEDAVVHELAHQWFGDSVSLENWKDIWLKEGMATYAQLLWATRDSDLEALTRMVESRLIGYLPRAPVAEPPAENLYRAEVYDGGAVVFHALRLKVGDETFFKIIRTYLDRYRYGNAGTDEFVQVAEEVSGQDLQAFFDAWLESKNQPELTP
jgi:aminopeptidase N